MTLFGGTAGAQLIVILATPILTRIYSPADFGIFGIFSSLLALLLVIAGLRYELAIPLPEEETDAASVLGLSLGLIFITSITTAILVWLFVDEIAHIMNAPAFATVAWLLPIGIFTGGISQSMNYWCVRTHRFNSIAQAGVSRSIAMVISQGLIGIGARGPIGLVTGPIVGAAVAFSIMGRGMRDATRTVFIRSNAPRIAKMAKRYVRFPKFSTWNGLTNTAGVQLPLLIFATVFSPVVAGLYMLAHRLVAMPLNLIGHAVGQVFYARAADANRDGSLETVASRILDGLLRISVGSVVVLAVVGPSAIYLIFGAEWLQSGIFIRLLSPWLVAVLVFSPFSVLYSVLEFQGQGLLFQAILLAGRIAALVMGALFGDVFLAVALYSVAGALIWSGFGILLLQQAGVDLRAILSRIGMEFLFVSPFAVMLIVIVQYSHRLGLATNLTMGIHLAAAVVAGIGIFLLRIFPIVGSSP